jgi:Na+-driven multidrug efflux pump
LKLCSAFATGTVIALSEEKGLRALGVVSWMTIGLSVVASLLAVPWGLVGVLYGVSAGWLVRSLIAGWMAMPYLRRPGARLLRARYEDRSQMPGAPR